MSLLKKSSILLALIAMAAFSPSRAQTIDTYTATGSGITTGTWDTAANWSTGAVPTSSVDVVLTNPFASANAALVTLTMGTDFANSIWELQNFPDRTGGGGVTTNLGFTLGTSAGQGTLTIGSAGNTSHEVTVNGTTFNYGIVNTETFANTFNITTVNSNVTFLNPNTAVAGNVTFNGTVTGAGTFLQTAMPSAFGGSPGETPSFLSSSVIFGAGATLSGFTTIEATTDALGDGGHGGGITFSGAPATVTGSPNVILAGGQLNLLNSGAYTFGTLTLDAGQDLLVGSSKNTTFTGLTVNTGASLAITSGDAIISSEAGGTGTGNLNPNNVNGIVGGWGVTIANFGDWLTYGSNGVVTSLVGIASSQGGYTYDDNINGTGTSASGSGVFASAWTSTMNIDFGNTVTSSGVTNSPTISDSLAGNTTINSLRFGVASSVASSTTFLASATLDVKGSVLTVGTGGILEAPGTTGAGFLGTSIIDSAPTGTSGITAGAGQQLYIWNTASDGGTLAAPKFTISAAIEDNGAPVSVVIGSEDNNSLLGVTNFTGTNTYTGNTYLNGGDLIIHSSAGLGATTNSIVFGGGLLDVESAMNLSRNIVVDAGQGGTLQVERIVAGLSGGALGNISQAASGVVLSGGISGTVPLTIASGSIAVGSGTIAIVDMTGTDTFTGPLILGSTGETVSIDVYLDNISGNAINNDVYLAGGNDGANMVWLANNQIADTAVVNLSPDNTNTSSVAFLNGFTDTIGGLIETDVATTNGGGAHFGYGEDEFENGSSTTAATLTLDTVPRTDVANGNYYFTGLLANGGTAALNIVKTGSATQIFTGRNTYTGTTTVNEGTLLYEASNAGTVTTTGGGNYAINGGGDPSNSGPATFGGFGTVALAASKSFTFGGTDASHLGILYPGPNGSAALQAGVNTVLNLGVAGTPVTVNLNAFSELKLDIGATLNSTLTIQGNLVINSGAILSLNMIGTPTAPSYDLVNYTGTLTGTSTGGPGGSAGFNTVNNVPAGYQIDYSTPNEILLDTASVPEPSVMAMMVGALGMLVFVLRRRNKVNDASHTFVASRKDS